MRVARGLALCGLLGCQPATTRPSFTPLPEADVVEVRLAPQEATKLLAERLRSDSVPIGRLGAARRLHRESLVRLVDGSGKQATADRHPPRQGTRLGRSRPAGLHAAYGGNGLPPPGRPLAAPARARARGVEGTSRGGEDAFGAGQSGEAIWRTAHGRKRARGKGERGREQRGRGKGERGTRSLQAENAE